MKRRQFQAEQAPGHPQHIPALSPGKPLKEKDPENFRALVIGGGTRNRTRVRFPDQIVMPRPLGREFDDLAGVGTRAEASKTRRLCLAITRAASPVSRRHCWQPNDPWTNRPVSRCRAPEMKLLLAQQLLP